MPVLPTSRDCALPGAWPVALSYLPGTRYSVLSPHSRVPPAAPLGRLDSDTAPRTGAPSIARAARPSLTYDTTVTLLPTHCKTLYSTLLSPTHALPCPPPLLLCRSIPSVRPVLDLVILSFITRAVMLLVIYRSTLTILDRLVHTQSPDFDFLSARPSLFVRYTYASAGSAARHARPPS